MNWKDTSSYSRDSEEKIPSVLKCKIGSLEIIVHRIHGLGGWRLTCRYLDIKDFLLKGEDLEFCQHQATVIVKKSLYAKVQEMQDILVLIIDF